MARRPYVHLAGDLSGWPKGLVPTPALLRRLDQYSSELVNGEDGGTWTPAAPIVLGPYRSPTLFLGTAGSVLSGDIITARGNADASERDRPGLVLVDGAVPVCQTARTRSVVVSLGSWSEDNADNAAASSIDFEIDPVTLGAKNVLADNAVLMVPLPLRAQHAGATIGSVDFRYVVTAGDAALPANLPVFRVVKCSAGTLAPLHTAAAPYDANGWLPDPAGTAAAFFNNGQTKTITYTPDQNHTSIDPSNAFWAVQVRGMDGGGVYLSATVHLTSIADMRQE